MCAIGGGVKGGDGGGTCYIFFNLIISKCIFFFNED